MTQVLHIFRKDTRRFWPEIALVLALTAAIIAMAPYEWRGNPYYGDISQQVLRELAMLLSPLLVIAWVLLISRVVHAEPLVGDRQFWITRPYEWKKLLAAKALFVAAYVVAPLLAMQCAVLARAGFAPGQWIAGLLLNLVVVAAMILLPMVAVATVTSGFGRVALAVIGVVLAWVLAAVGQALLAQRHPESQGALEPIGTLAMYGLLLGVCAAVVLVQYATRKTRTAVLLLGGMVAGLAAIACAGPDRRVIDRMYPQGNGPAPAVLTLDGAVRSHSDMETTWPGSDMVGTEVPLMVSGVAEGYRPLFDEVKFTIEGANGVNWQSGWQHLAYPRESGAVTKIAGGNEAGGGGGSEAEVSAEKDLRVQIMMPRAVYEEVKGTPVALHMTLAVTEAKIANVTEVSGLDGEFRIAGVGYCEAAGFPVADRESSSAGYVACRSALHAPLTSMRVRTTYLPCPADHSGNTTEETRTTWGSWEGSSDRIATNLFLVPMASRNEMIERGFVSDHGVALCSERVTLMFTRYQPVGRTQVGVTLEDYRLTGDGGDGQ